MIIKILNLVKEIYPVELELGKENEGYQNASFLRKRKLPRTLIWYHTRKFPYQECLFENALIDSLQNKTIEKNSTTFGREKNVKSYFSQVIFSITYQSFCLYFGEPYNLTTSGKKHSKEHSLL